MDDRAAMDDGDVNDPNRTICDSLPRRCELYSGSPAMRSAST